jgi:hypothetical protein
MIKWLGTVLTLLVCLNGPASAENLTKKSEGHFITDKTPGKLAMKPGQRLIIHAASTLAGEMNLKAGGNDCRFEYWKLLKTPTKVEAADYAKLIGVEVETIQDAVVLSFHAPVPAPWSGTNNSGRLSIDIKIPEGCPVEVNTAYFDVTAVGPFSEFTVTESLSKVDIAKVIGGVDVKVSNRPLNIKDVVGKVAASNKYDRIRLENIDTGDDLGIVSNEHGEIIIEGYRGGLDVRTSYDRLVGQHLFLTGDRNRVKNISALISLSFDSLTTGSIRVNNQYENISLEIAHRVDAEFICKIGENGLITADHLDFVPDLVDESRLEFTSGEGQAEVRVTARGSGEITINGPNKKDITGGK